MSEQINASKKFLINKGIIRSVSIILFSSEEGFLLCDEMRKGFPDKSILKLSNHTIGGKVEMDDFSPIYTGIREFIEEVDFYLGDREKDEMINFLIEELNECKTLKWDYCVSDNKRLYNRFYVINIDQIVNEEIKSQIFSFIKCWKKKENSTLEKIYFWRRGQKLDIKTNLLEVFINNLPPMADLLQIEKKSLFST